MPSEPRERITLRLPEGVIGIRHASCPKGCDLMDPDRRIHDLPSIRLRYAAGDAIGIVHLDPLYGRFETIHDQDPPVGSIVEFSCPSCGLSLRSDEGTCQICAGPLFTLHLKSGIVEGCLRRGCLYHRMTIVDSGALMERLFTDRKLDPYL